MDTSIVIIGDSAYPLLTWLMKPFPHKGALTEGEKRFNHQLSTARVVSENAFGRLKGRWRCLMKRMDMKPEYIPIVITACCTLHNICEIHGEEFDTDWLPEAISQPSDDTPTDTTHLSASTSGTDVRNNFVKHFEFIIMVWPVVHVHYQSVQ